MLLEQRRKWSILVDIDKEGCRGRQGFASALNTLILWSAPCTPQHCIGSAKYELEGAVDQLTTPFFLLRLDESGHGLCEVHVHATDSLHFLSKCCRNILQSPGLA